jgi:hypothetical protein
MTTVYTTECLLRILADEYRACVNGQRLNLAATVSGVNPLIDQFLNAEGIQKFTAYLDFRATIHRYQLEHQVSGIVWRQIEIADHTLEYPEVDEQLIALPNDLKILQAAKPRVLSFWQQVVCGEDVQATLMDLYLVVNRGQNCQAIAQADVRQLAQRTEWASLAKHEHTNFLELVLQLGWGKPSEALYKRGWPESGSEFVYAVSPGHHPII